MDLVIDKPIFLTIHYTETKKKISAFISDYNSKLESEWESDKAAFLKKYNQTYNQLRFKACHMNSVYAILDMYASFLKRNRRMQLFGAKFRLNNVALATKLNKLASKVTSWRHITKALEIGILSNKVFHGSNSSFEISFNPQLLVAEYNPEYCELLVDYWCDMFKTDKMPVENYLQLTKQSPLFTDFPAGCMLSSCNDTVTRSLQEQNSNMISGISAKSGDYLLIYEPEHGGADPRNKPSAEEASSAQSNDQAEGNVPRPIDADEAITRDENELITSFSKFAWGFAKSTIFTNRYVAPADEKLVYQFLRQFFAPGIKYNNGLSTLYNNFCERLMLAMKWQQRNPDYTFMNPATYFNPATEKGFRATKQWLIKVKAKRKTSEEYNSNNKLLAELCKNYSLNPNPDNYRMATQKLAKKRSKVLLEIFNEFVVNGEKIHPELFIKSYAAMIDEDSVSNN